MKIAIIGGGIFGVQIAIKLSKNHSVEIFEKNGNILNSASGINQYRLHRGYHYPRSNETVQSSLYSENKFRKEFSDAIIDNNEHYYCIAKENSFTNSEQYIKFCKSNNLEFIKHELESQVRMLLAGMVACNIKYDEHSSSAKGDLGEAKEIVQKMCQEYGMGETLLGDTHEEKRVLERLFAETSELLGSMPKLVDRVEEILVERESISKAEVIKLINEIL